MGATVNRLRKNGQRLSVGIEDPEVRFYYLLNESCFYSLIGFFVCGVFLSLQAYSVWYYLLLMANAALHKSESIHVGERQDAEIERSGAVYGKVRLC